MGSGAMALMNDTSTTGIIKPDTRGRNRHAAEFKRQVLDAFGHRGPGGMQFAAQCGVKDPTFASWVKQRREEGASPDPGERKGPAKQQFLLAGIRDVREEEAGLSVRLPGGVVARVNSRKQVSLLVELVKALA